MLLSQNSYISFWKCSLFMTILLLLQVAQNWPFRIVDSKCNITVKSSLKFHIHLHVIKCTLQT